MTLGELATGFVASVSRPLGNGVLALGDNVRETFECFKTPRNSALQNPEIMRNIPAFLKKAPPGFVIVESGPYAGLAQNPVTGAVRFPKIVIPKSMNLGDAVLAVRDVEDRVQSERLGLGLLTIIFFVILGISLAPRRE